MFEGVTRFITNDVNEVEALVKTNFSINLNLSSNKFLIGFLINILK